MNFYLINRTNSNNKTRNQHGSNSTNVNNIDSTDISSGLVTPRSSLLSRKLRRPLSMISVSSSSSLGNDLNSPLSPEIVASPTSPSSFMPSTITRKKMPTSISYRSSQSDPLSNGLSHFDSSEISTEPVYRKRSSSIGSTNSVNSTRVTPHDAKANTGKILPPVSELTLNPVNDQPGRTRGHRRKGSRLESLVKWRRSIADSSELEQYSESTVSKKSTKPTSKSSISSPIPAISSGDVSPISSPTSLLENSSGYTTSRPADYWKADNQYKVQNRFRSSSSISYSEQKDDFRYIPLQEGKGGQPLPVAFGTNGNTLNSHHMDNTALSDMNHIPIPLKRLSHDIPALSTSPIVVWIGHEAIETCYRGEPVISPRSHKFEHEETFNPFDEVDDIDMRRPSQVTVRTQFW